MAQLKLKRRTGKRDPIAVSCVGWMDLLGYGASLREAGFDPAHPKASAAVARLRSYHATLQASATSRYPILPINDGAAFHRDLSYRDGQVGVSFIDHLLTIHRRVNELDAAAGFPGARLIVAVGFRVRDPKQPIRSQHHISAILRRLRRGSLGSEQAIYDAFYTTPIFGSLPELQANFAFSKAYLADSDGSKAGLGGPRFYLDSAIVEGVPRWLKISRSVQWSHPGLSATFHEVADLDIREAIRDRFVGARTAAEVAAALRAVGA